MRVDSAVDPPGAPISGHTISREYVEHESSRKGADRRKQFAALFEDAAKRKFDCALFWALDRSYPVESAASELTRSSIRHAMAGS